MFGSITRGAVLASSIALVLALPRALDLPAAIWVTLLLLAHVALPFAAALWPRRADALTFDAALAGVGLAYIGLLALSPHESGWLYGGAPLGYALYAFLATLGFMAASRWRTAARVRGLARLRGEARARHRTRNAALS